jgi:phage gp45-like
MHRATPLQTSFRAYTSGGARSAVHEVDDSKGMQLSKSNGMKNETREKIESPQNYGFTSVVADGDKGDNNSLKDSAEAVMNFLGGNRSFPMTTSMDDRRHRLLNLAKDAAKGAAAMFGLKEWGQQFLNTDDGMHMTGNKEKKIRISLVENQNGKKSPSGGDSSGSGGSSAASLSSRATHFVSKSGVEFAYADAQAIIDSRAADGGGGSGGAGGASSSSGGDQKTTKGQKTLHKEETDIQIEQNGTSTTTQHGQAYAMQKSGSDSSAYFTDKKKSAQVTDDHCHIRFKDHRIFNDEDGNWCTSPLLVKKDQYCKES